MRGLILSGGDGKRLRPITHTSAKQLLPVANKPILFYGIEEMAKAGIEEVGIVIAPTTGEAVREAVGDGSRFGVRITWLLQDEPLGLAHAVLVARDFLGQDDFVMYLGDNMLQDGLARLVEEFRSARIGDVGAFGRQPSALILLSKVSNPSAFGVAEISDSGDVIGLVEKPASPRSDLALVGVYFFDATIHQAIEKLEPSPRGEYEITDALGALIDDGYRVAHEVLSGWWLDTGKKDSLLECNRLLLETLPARIDGEVDARSVVEGQVVIEAGAKVVGSVVRGPVIIGAGATVSQSKVGPYVSIAANCLVSNSQLDNSVLLERSSVCDFLPLSQSLVGKETKLLRRTEGGPDFSSGEAGAANLLVGDHCRVEIS